ncbi:unnamed protein product [Oppiella nova]|uniref:Uncharacterized protein n=1 Tax=Oppiella nova TaxID=334625 RepID=A0A7R9QQ69_9ACAR|nr:unnamed protein product [Oppiella nova]CAG2169778.1 unnamed protein product [Oppiella nova]
MCETNITYNHIPVHSNNTLTPYVYHISHAPTPRPSSPSPIAPALKGRDGRNSDDNNSDDNQGCRCLSSMCCCCCCCSPTESSYASSPPPAPSIGNIASPDRSDPSPGPPMMPFFAANHHTGPPGAALWNSIGSSNSAHLSDNNHRLSVY